MATSDLIKTYAKHRSRLTASFIDGGVSVFLGFVCGGVFAVTGGYDYIEKESTWAILSFFGLMFTLIALYHILFTASSRQATLGKFALGLSVGDKDGNRISKGQSTIRFFSSLLSGLLLCVGYAMVLFNKEHASLHDLIAKTRVYETGNKSRLI